jgi:hypothetical protein
MVHRWWRILLVEILLNFSFFAFNDLTDIVNVIKLFSL